MGNFIRLLSLSFVFILSACASNNTENSAPPQRSAAERPNMNSADPNSTYDKENVINAASEFFGEGSEAVASVIEKAFADLGRPNGYIIGTEASAALIVGARYGDGVLSHKIEGDTKVYWKGPSIGIDVGANGSRVFALVYNLNDTQELYQRFPAVEGSLYYVAGVGMNYQQVDEIVIAPIRMGVGLRAGVNLGYLHFTKERSWNPF
ncbi:DUF1134 domain-containing protein [Pseudemcibacter aquimaris]|uniref:DUF1134 domain-containing protein n=1 Tax=Pseudemcibacter aquimaris TaxID=2857064 RepID=UPI0020114172|nr:DUF1134 domain-containing protein [Pseudemcibacter aquimaris]MCC3861331.1 DUF1134 domain-containing protein [Pseudemcibacter aquimaris]WDU58103.1 DUF1134 domain-containing protein [Pseudemcibacter aquimaris]